MTDEQFIQAIAPTAVNLYRTKHISAALTIAQACLETLYGQHCPANNMFGIKADASWHGEVSYQRTWEVYSGVRQIVTAKFRAYKTLGDSLVDHCNFLLENPRYHNLIGVDYRTACNEIARIDHYATDPQYGSKLLWIINHFGLAKYDVVAKPQQLGVLYRVFLGGKKISSYAYQSNAESDAKRHFYTVVVNSKDNTSVFVNATTIKKGSANFFVKKVQQLLHLKDSGIFDVATEDAVKAYQKSVGLISDGEVGPNTWSHLLYFSPPKFEEIKPKQIVKPEEPKKPTETKPAPPKVEPVNVPEPVKTQTPATITVSADKAVELVDDANKAVSLLQRIIQLLKSMFGIGVK